MQIRSADLTDAAAWAEITVACSPLVIDEASAAHEMRTDPSAVRRVVAEVGGNTVGIGHCRLHDDQDHTSLTIMVRPEHRRRGVGRALLDAFAADLAHSGKSAAHTIVEDDIDSQAAAARWGFELTRTFRMAAVDPRTLPVPENDSRIVPLADRHREEIFELHNRIVVDDPSGLSLPQPWEDWLADWNDPRNRPALSRGVVVDGRLVAFSVIGTAGDRAWSQMTGTDPAHRGRGLARLAKHHTLYGAARAGISRCMTGNDSANQPMLAINDRLGYRVLAVERLGVRQLGGLRHDSMRP